jgi:hypothetical protein
MAHASEARRSRERGATLTIISFSTCLLLMALGSTYMAAAQNIYRLAAERGRQAQAREAAESAVSLGAATFASGGMARHGLESLPQDARATWEITSVQGDRATILADGAVGVSIDRVEVHLIAEVERAAGGSRPHVLRVTRK